MQMLNRLIVAFLSGIVAIGLLVLIVVVWADPGGGVGQIEDLAGYLDDRTDDNLARTLISLGAATVASLGLMLLILEVSPEGRDRIRLSASKDGMTELAAASVNHRVEFDLRRLAAVRDARAEVRSHAKGVAVRLQLWVEQDANLAATSDEACRLVKETIEDRIGVPVVRPPNVYLRYAEPAATAETPPSIPSPSLAPPAGAGAGDQPESRPADGDEPEHPTA